MRPTPPPPKNAPPTGMGVPNPPLPVNSTDQSRATSPQSPRTQTLHSGTPSRHKTKMGSIRSINHGSRDRPDQPHQTPDSTNDSCIVFTNPPPPPRTVGRRTGAPQLPHQPRARANGSHLPTRPRGARETAVGKGPPTPALPLSSEWMVVFLMQLK